MLHSAHPRRNPPLRLIAQKISLPNPVPLKDLSASTSRRQSSQRWSPILLSCSGADRSTLSSAGAAHDWPDVDDLFAASYVIAIVHVGAHVEVRRVEINALTELVIPVAILPDENAVFSALVFHLDLRTAFHLVSGLEQRLVAGVNGALVRMPFADHRGHYRKRRAEVAVDCRIVFAADFAVNGIHEDKRTGLELR